MFTSSEMICSLLPRNSQHIISRRAFQYLLVAVANAMRRINIALVNLFQLYSGTHTSSFVKIKYSKEKQDLNIL